MTASRIRLTLEAIGAINPNDVGLFSDRTRDRNIPVWRDSTSGVIFIEDFFVGDDEYSSGSYRGTSHEPTFEDLSDTRRRVGQFRPLYYGKKVIDFGCGAGTFLRSIQKEARTLQGVELQESYRDGLLGDGIECFVEISKCSEADVLFMFHVLEHLPDPLPILRQALDLVRPSHGEVVIEVPHANDFLITQVKCQPFINFTLWSQHLILHTRDSLRRLLSAAGFAEISIFGEQRYGLSNHLRWLSEGLPGGHLGALSAIETQQLRDEYKNALAAIDATDTLIAVAR